jgi:hypothetical protein
MVQVKVECGASDAAFAIVEAMPMRIKANAVIIADFIKNPPTWDLL